MSSISTLDTPCALIDVTRMAGNISRMQSQLDRLGVRFRPHVKTAKCQEVAQAQIEAGAQGVTVSTLKEAEEFFDSGITDIVYAVGIVATKLPQVLALRRRGCDLKIIADSVPAAQAVVAFGQQHGERFEVWIEVDVDDHRSGIKPDDDLLIAVGRTLVDGGMQLGGVLAHAGSSYECNTRAALVAMAEQERSRSVHAAKRLRAAGLPCPVVSIGSTPTALSAEQLEGVTEVRAGVYVFFDLVMHNVGVCTLDEIALSVLTTVIGHQEDKGWAIVDAGWMALSRDRGTQRQPQDFGYGQVCTADGEVLAGYVVSGANQEHGIIAATAGVDKTIAQRLPIGTRLRILPNHACATGAQHPVYQAIDADGNASAWPRFYGW
ncbi:MAG: D-threo-3-hydroxyaspartate dehydratase [Paracidovorax wautersii]|uniref:D-threo-3-hydroxyaspartate dehydratase n=1 Tax=Paracidovorax wautersii TaxID=1177982 RepID=A0A7V8JQ86_9BURK|nr:MAG: D-threo-3-hydroxyaspartate dehydratase [Paracidovorax wautersii]